MKLYTKEEDNFIKFHYQKGTAQKLTVSQIAKKLKRSIKSIENRLFKLRLVVQPKKELTKQLKFKIRNYHGMGLTCAEIGRELNLSNDFIERCMKKMNLKPWGWQSELLRFDQSVIKIKSSRKTSMENFGNCR